MAGPLGPTAKGRVMAPKKLTGGNRQPKRTLPIINRHRSSSMSSDDDKDEDSTFSKSTAGTETEEADYHDAHQKEEEEEEDDDDDEAFETANEESSSEVESGDQKVVEPERTRASAKEKEQLRSKQLELKERKELYEQEKKEILDSLPTRVKDLYGQIGFVKMGRATLPCVVLSPFDVEEKFRSRWKNQWVQAKIKNGFENLPLLVFLYGVHNSVKPFELVEPNKFINYEEGSKKGFHKLPSYLEQKKGDANLRKSEQMRISGIQEMQKELTISPEDRRELCICFSEAHEAPPQDQSLWEMTRGERRRFRGLEKSDDSSSSSADAEEDNAATPATDTHELDDTDDEPDSKDIERQAQADGLKLFVVVDSKREARPLPFTTPRGRRKGIFSSTRPGKTKQRVGTALRRSDRCKLTNDNDNEGPSSEEIAQADAALRLLQHTATSTTATTKQNNPLNSEKHGDPANSDDGDSTAGGKNGGKSFVPPRPNLKLKISMPRNSQTEKKSTSGELASKGEKNPRAAAWDKMYAMLVEYKEKNGSCKVPNENSKFNNWVRNQRTILGKKIRDGKLDETAKERIEKLEKIDFWPANTKTSGGRDNELKAPAKDGAETDTRPTNNVAGPSNDTTTKRKSTPVDDQDDAEFGCTPPKKRFKALQIRQAKNRKDGRGSTVSDSSAPVEEKDNTTSSPRKSKGSAKASDQPTSKTTTETTQPKRRPGRPRKKPVAPQDGKLGIFSNVASAPPKKRGRPRKQRPQEPTDGKIKQSANDREIPVVEPPQPVEGNKAAKGTTQKKTSGQTETKQRQPRGIAAKLKQKGKNKNAPPLRWERSKRPSTKTKNVSVEERDLPPLEDIALEVGTSTSDLTNREEIEHGAEGRGSHKIIDLPRAAGVLPPPRFQFNQESRPPSLPLVLTEDGTYERPNEDPPGRDFFWCHKSGLWITRPKPSNVEVPTWQRSQSRSNTRQSNLESPNWNAHPKSPSRGNSRQANLETPFWPPGGSSSPDNDLCLKILGVRYDQIPREKSPDSKVTMNSDLCYERPKGPTFPGYSWHEGKGKWTPLDQERFEKKLVTMSDSEKAQLRGWLASQVTRERDVVLSPSSLGMKSLDEADIHQQILQGRDGLVSNIPVAGAAPVFNDCASLVNPRDPAWYKLLSPGCGASLPSISSPGMNMRTEGLYDWTIQFPDSERDPNAARRDTEKLGISPVPPGAGKLHSPSRDARNNAEIMAYRGEKEAPPEFPLDKCTQAKAPEGCVWDPIQQSFKPCSETDRGSASNNLGIPALNDSALTGALSLRPREENGTNEDQLRQIEIAKTGTPLGEAPAKLTGDRTGKPQQMTLESIQNFNKSDSPSNASTKGQESNEGASSLSTAPAENVKNSSLGIGIGHNPTLSKAGAKPGIDGAVTNSERNFSAVSQTEEGRLAMSSRDEHSISGSVLPKGFSKLAPSSPALISKEGGSVDGSGSIALEKVSGDAGIDEKAQDSCEHGAASKKDTSSRTDNQPKGAESIPNRSVAETTLRLQQLTTTENSVVQTALRLQQLSKNRAGVEDSQTPASKPLPSATMHGSQEDMVDVSSPVPSPTREKGDSVRLPGVIGKNTIDKNTDRESPGHNESSDGLSAVQKEKAAPAPEPRLKEAASRNSQGDQNMLRAQKPKPPSSLVTIEQPTANVRLESTFVQAETGKKLQEIPTTVPKPLKKHHPSASERQQAESASKKSPLQKIITSTQKPATKHQPAAKGAKFTTVPKPQRSAKSAEQNSPGQDGSSLRSKPTSVPMPLVKEAASKESPSQHLPAITQKTTSNAQPAAKSAGQNRTSFGSKPTSEPKPPVKEASSKKSPSQHLPTTPQKTTSKLQPTAKAVGQNTSGLGSKPTTVPEPPVKEAASKKSPSQHVPTSTQKTTSKLQPAAQAAGQNTSGLVHTTVPRPPVKEATSKKSPSQHVPTSTQKTTSKLQRAAKAAGQNTSGLVSKPTTVPRPPVKEATSKKSPSQHPPTRTQKMTSKPQPVRQNRTSLASKSASISKLPGKEADSNKSPPQNLPTTSQKPIPIPKLAAKAAGQNLSGMGSKPSTVPKPPVKEVHSKKSPSQNVPKTTSKLQPATQAVGQNASGLGSKPTSVPMQPVKEVHSNKSPPQNLPTTAQKPISTPQPAAEAAGQNTSGLGSKPTIVPKPPVKEATSKKSPSQHLPTRTQKTTSKPKPVGQNRTSLGSNSSSELPGKEADSKKTAQPAANSIRPDLTSVSEPPVKKAAISKKPFEKKAAPSLPTPKSLEQTRLEQKTLNEERIPTAVPGPQVTKTSRKLHEEENSTSVQNRRERHPTATLVEAKGVGLRQNPGVKDIEKSLALKMPHATQKPPSAAKSLAGPGLKPTSVKKTLEQEESQKKSPQQMSSTNVQKPTSPQLLPALPKGSGAVSQSNCQASVSNDQSTDASSGKSPPETKDSTLSQDLMIGSQTISKQQSTASERTATVQDAISRKPLAKKDSAVLQKTTKPPPTAASDSSPVLKKSSTADKPSVKNSAIDRATALEPRRNAQDVDSSREPLNDFRKKSQTTHTRDKETTGTALAQAGALVMNITNSVSAVAGRLMGAASTNGGESDSSPPQGHSGKDHRSPSTQPKTTGRALGNVKEDESRFEAGINEGEGGTAKKSQIVDQSSLRTAEGVSGEMSAKDSGNENRAISKRKRAEVSARTSAEVVQRGKTSGALSETTGGRTTKKENTEGQFVTMKRVPSKRASRKSVAASYAANSFGHDAEAGGVGVTENNILAQISEKEQYAPCSPPAFLHATFRPSPLDLKRRPTKRARHGKKDDRRAQQRKSPSAKRTPERSLSPEPAKRRRTHGKERTTPVAAQVKSPEPPRGPRTNTVAAPVPDPVCCIIADDIPSTVGSISHVPTQAPPAPPARESKVLEVEDPAQPHFRHECTSKPFKSRHLGSLETVSMNNKIFCPNCLCFVCGVSPRECSQWGTHQNATPDDIIWNDMRTIEQRRRKKLEQS